MRLATTGYASVGYTNMLHMLVPFIKSVNASCLARMPQDSTGFASRYLTWSIRTPVDSLYKLRIVTVPYAS